MPGPKSPAHVALGQAIRRVREQRGVSQEEMAYSAGLHRNYLGGVERGERNLGFTNLVRISGALGVRTSELVELAEEIGGTSFSAVE